MNQIDPIVDDQRGLILTDNVDLAWLNSLTPRYHNEYVKFVVDMKNNKVAVGMDVHADAKMILGVPEEYLYGGNIYTDGHIVYQSTLNIQKNLIIQAKKSKKGILRLFLKSGNRVKNMRIITDKETISYINTVLLEWVIL